MGTRWMPATIIVCALTMVRFVSAAQPEQRNTLPEQINHYYATCNAVNLYSTADERFALSRYPLVDALPEELNTNRLRQVHKLMQLIWSRELELDPKISRGPLAEFKGTPSGLVIVDKIDPRREKLRVSVTVYQDDKELIRRLVADFESSPGAEIVPPSQEKVRTMVGSRLSRREIHTWVKQDGTWIKQAVNLVLLDGSARPPISKPLKTNRR